MKALKDAVSQYCNTLEYYDTIGATSDFCFTGKFFPMLHDNRQLPQHYMKCVRLSHNSSVERQINVKIIF